MRDPEAPSRVMRYRKQYLLDVARGVPRGYVPLVEVLGHVEHLMAMGASAAGIARAAGIGDTTVQDLVRRQRGGCQQKTAAAILSVTMRMVLTDQGGSIAKHGAARRVQALYALGWRSGDITAASGVNAHWVMRTKGRITTANYTKLCAAYDRMSMSHGPSDITRRRAARNGWFPPLAWDDDTIDDPTATPSPCISLAGHRVDIAEVELLISSGEPWSELSRRLGYTRNSIEKALGRNRRLDLVRRAGRNSEGEYVLNHTKRNQFTA